MRSTHHTVRNAICLTLLLVAPSAATAGGPDDQSPRVANSSPTPDFFIGRPHASLGLRGNWFMASANSDLFDFVTKHLTLERTSFNTPTFGGELGISLSSRLDLVASFEFGKSATPSEYRDFVDNKLLPIQQTTSFKRTDITGTLRYALLPKGRSISRLAWIPRVVTPYVGAGGGMLGYEFQQTGDFVDFQDLRVFTDVFDSSGWAPSAHVLGGVDVQIYRHVFMSFEGKYTWSSAKLEQKFIHFAPIDLGGARYGAGIHLVF